MLIKFCIIQQKDVLTPQYMTEMSVFDTNLKNKKVNFVEINLSTIFIRSARIRLKDEMLIWSTKS